MANILAKSECLNDSKNSTHQAGKLGNISGKVKHPGTRSSGITIVALAVSGPIRHITLI